MTAPISPLAALFDTYPLIEDFTPMRDSRVWSISAEWWRDRGPSAFTDAQVPYLVTSDGALSQATAAVIHALYRQREREGTTPARLTLIELGPGSGLFARLTLLHLRALLGQDAPHFHYVAIDAARPMLDALEATILSDLDWLEVTCCVIDLSTGSDALSDALAGHLSGDDMAIFVANYALDSIPATVLHRPQEGAPLQEAAIELRDGRPKGADQVAPFARMRWTGPVQAHPLLDQIEAVLTKTGETAPFNATALDLLTRLQEMMPPISAIFINDYETAAQTTALEPVQVFGGSFATGLHFPTLDRVMGKTWEVLSPDTPNDRIASRAYMPFADENLRALYGQSVSPEKMGQGHSWVTVARGAAEQSEIPRALAAYEAAIAANPLNWSLITEVAGFTHAKTEHHETALALATEAVRLNPTATTAMRVAASCLRRLERDEEAREVLGRALVHSRRDPGLLLDFGKMQAATCDPNAALTTIAEALALSPSEAVSAELVALQQSVLTR